jgi:hypothetical protein
MLFVDVVDRGVEVGFDDKLVCGFNVALFDDVFVCGFNIVVDLFNVLDTASFFSFLFGASIAIASSPRGRLADAGFDDF